MLRQNQTTGPYTESFIDFWSIFSHYRDFFELVVPILTKYGARIGSIGTLFLLCLLTVLPRGTWSKIKCRVVCFNYNNHKNSEWFPETPETPLKPCLVVCNYLL